MFAHWLKNCCNFSLTRLMQICSNVLNSKISNPAMSSTPMNVTFFIVGSLARRNGKKRKLNEGRKMMTYMRVQLHMSTM